MKNIKFKSKFLIVLTIAIFSIITSCEESRFDQFDKEFIESIVVPVASFEFTIQDKLVTFTNNSQNADTYSWNFDDDNAFESFAKDTVFTFSNSVETATIVLNARNTASNVTNQTSKVLTFVKADFEVSDLTNKTVTFQNNSIAAVSYSWDFGDGLGTSTEENPTYIYPNFGTYAVSLVVTDTFGNEDTINTEVVVAEPGAGTFEATIIAGDFNKDNWGGNIQNPWAVNPDNSSDYDFWDNIALESVVQALEGGSDKGSTSGTSNLTPGSLKLDKASKRAYQPINIEKDVDYTITAYVKNKNANNGDLVGTFYVLPYIPADETVILTNNIIAKKVFASESGAWDEAIFEFNPTTVFSFDQSAVDKQDDDILTSVNQQWVILYFVPDLSTAGEINLDDFSIATKGF
ncbi:PKD domain-containing protein [Polaribacter sp. Hel1_85]|uniref:PKD domain-containing protein n=1 Tax=Polaribacter sp. Hel1_85 TaxID=1250005 RepID=UPI00052DAB6A|nr:PKD domain-containing protein [Polaribacter sp. Hel1_85]KGL61799.1 PKD domain protein [Polaribacter sp. Hel1_85]